MELLGYRHRRIQVFLSSVFYENGIAWPLRENVANKLEEQQYNVWRWEKQGEYATTGTGRTGQEIIAEAIKQSDVLVAFYKSRAGNVFFEGPQVPFYATDFEIVEAIGRGIPVRLYIVKSGLEIEDELKQVLSLLKQPTIIDGYPRYCDCEEHALQLVLRDIKELFMHALYDNRSIRLLDNELVAIDPEEAEFYLTLQSESGNYGVAYTMLSGYANLEQAKPKARKAKILFARYFSRCANIYANRAEYKKAVRFSLKTIRLLLEAREWNEMFGQIQALSGICNMAGMQSSWLLNTYGYKAVRQYPNLASAYNDSRASILRNAGRYEEARILLENDWEQSPYSGAKYAHALSFSPGRNSISKARNMIHDHILPDARLKGSSVEYVLRQAAVLAIRDMDFISAKKFLDEAETIAVNLGALHALLNVEQIRRGLPK